MKVCVFAGSPKGEMSITLQYVNFLRNNLKDVTFETHHVCQLISKLEKNDAAFDEVIHSAKGSDLILWAFPLYVCLVHSGYKRFIELILPDRP